MAASLIERLKGGDRRSLGNANSIASEIEHNDVIFSEAFEAIFGSDPIIRMRAADAVEKATKHNPGLLTDFKKEILKRAPQCIQKEVRWHVALMLGYVQWNETEIARVIDLLLTWLQDDPSIIVKVNCLQTLADISLYHRWYRHEVEEIIFEQIAKGSPALKARGRILLKKFEWVESIITIQRKNSHRKNDL